MPRTAGGPGSIGRCIASGYRDDAARTCGVAVGGSVSGTIERTSVVEIVAERLGGPYLRVEATVLRLRTA